MQIYKNFLLYNIQKDKHFMFVFFLHYCKLNVFLLVDKVKENVYYQLCTKITVI